MGLGHIGTATALRTKAFGKGVNFNDPYVPRGQEIALGISRVETLAELLGCCDAVSLHAPLADEAIHLLNAERLVLMPPHAVLINTARGGLIDIDVLYSALNERRIGGGGLTFFPKSRQIRRTH